MTVPAYSSDLTDAATPAPKPRGRPRKASLFKNTSEGTRHSREIKLVEDDAEGPGTMGPSHMKAARFSCTACGMRSVESVHPPDPGTGLPICVALRMKLR